jgi:hypothetical protein
MFRDYKHRADGFVDAVRELAAERGADLEGTLCRPGCSPCRPACAPWWRA